MTSRYPLVLGPDDKPQELQPGDSLAIGDCGGASTAHAHSISDITGLQTAIDGKLALGKHTIWVPAAAMKARLTNGPAVGTLETASNKVTLPLLDYDYAVSEAAHFSVAMPKSWNRGTVTFDALWTAAGGSGGVVWGMRAVAIGAGDAIDAAFGAAQTTSGTFVSAGQVHYAAESAAITVAGFPAINDLTVFEIYRDVAVAADTLGQDARLIGVRLFYNTNAGNDA